MRIVLTRRDTPLHLPDGINVFLFALAESLIGDGHDVTLIGGPAYKPDEIDRIYGHHAMPRLMSVCSTERVSRARLAWLWAVRGRKLVAMQKPDITVINGALPVRLSGIACTVCHDLERRAATPGDVFRRAYKGFAYRRGDVTVVTCSELKDRLTNEIRLDPAQIKIIPTCVSPSGQPVPIEDRDDAILHLGTALYKNARATLRAFSRLGECDTKLFITGGISQQLRKEVEELKPDIAARVHLLGYIPASELDYRLRHARVLAVPSQYVAPVASPTVLDGFSAGTPVVASDSISRDLLRDGINGVCCDPNDDAEMAGALNTLLQDNSLWETYSAAALGTVRDFSPNTVAAKYMELLHDIEPAA